ncbi:MAG: response regulator [Thermodesulforhabdaceae bacterium]
MNGKVYILIIDPDEDTQDFFFRALTTQDRLQCFVSSTKEEAQSILNAFSIDLILMDIGIAGPPNFVTLREILSCWSHAVVLLTGSIHQTCHMKDAVSIGAHGYLIKPISLYSLRKIVNSFTKEIATVNIK